MGASSPFISRLVEKEVMRIVADAAKTGHTISASGAAAAILKTYPNCGLDEATVGNQIIMAAAAAGLAVEIGHPEARFARPQHPHTGDQPA